jgi:hypothetical protein
MAKEEDLCEQIDAIAKDWQQGDVAFPEMDFAHIADLSLPLTDVAAKYAEENSISDDEDSIGHVFTKVEGFAILTQTCDLQRSSNKKFIEVCPLIEVTANELKETKFQKRPSWAYIEGVSERHLVADLDRVMTLEKSFLLNWERTQGCHSDNDRRLLAKALSRKRARFAFPDDFGLFINNLRERIIKCRNASTDEGLVIRNIAEIKVRAAPSWEADKVELVFYFIKDGDTLDKNTEVDVIGNWMALLEENEKFTVQQYRIRKLKDIRANEYLEADTLDLDYLSFAPKI